MIRLSIIRFRLLPSINKIDVIAPLQVTILGTGTSQGVPVLGCECAVCSSSNPKDRRLRCSVLVSSQQTNVVIDVGPDFRQQILRVDLKQLDAILLTHEHNDHIAGLDDIRPFNFKQRAPMPIYGTRETLKALRDRFGYVFEPNPYPGAPRVKEVVIDYQQDIQIGDIRFTPIQVWHGKMPVMVFRIGDFAYCTDVKTIDDQEKSKLWGLDTLVINALHHHPHHSHLNLEEAIQMIVELRPKRAYLTHISHLMGLYDEINPSLPAGVELAYDGLQLDI